MIKTKEELIKVLDSSEINDEEKEEFIKFIEPFYDFYDFMLKEHKMTFEDVDKDSSVYSIEVFPEYLEDMKDEPDISGHLIGFSGDIMKRYAEKYGYSEPEKVGIALTKYVQIMFVDLLKEQKRNNNE